MNIFSSVSIGSLIAVMLLFNGSLSQHLGNSLASVIIHITGLFCTLFILFAKKLKIKIDKSIPIGLYSAGAIGVITVLCNNYSFTQLGASVTLALGLFGQSLSSIVIDHFGLLEMETIKFEKKKGIGLMLIAFGILIMTIF